MIWPLSGDHSPEQPGPKREPLWQRVPVSGPERTGCHPGHVMEPDRARPKDGALFAVNMLVSTAGGMTYTYDEIKGCLEQAGFIKVRLLQKGEHMDALVEAFKP